MRCRECRSRPGDNPRHSALGSRQTVQQHYPGYYSWMSGSFVNLRVLCGLCLLLLVLDRPGLAQNIGSYLGFDRNDYPGDASLQVLRRTFSYAGYWLNNPPGESGNGWTGKRQMLDSVGFGFLVLFNGRLDKNLKHNAAALG